MRKTLWHSPRSLLVASFAQVLPDLRTATAVRDVRKMLVVSVGFHSYSLSESLIVARS